MTDFPFAVVGFDLDGTLLDTSADLAAAVNVALAAIGRPPVSAARTKQLVGGGARQFLVNALADDPVDEATVDRLHRLLVEHYAANLAVETRPFPGVAAALDALAARGVRLGVMTNKLERFAVAVLDAYGLSDRFDAIIGGDTLHVGKPSPEPIHEMVARCSGGRAAFVGDSRFDVAAAHAAGLPAIICRFGFLDRPAEELGAEAIIDDFGALLPALEAL